MSVVLSNEEVGPCRRALKIEVPQPAVEAESQRVISEIRRGASLPGFRKGKVPERLIRQRFHQEIEQELLDRLVPRYWEQAQDEAAIEPLLPPQVGEVHYHAGTPLTFVATVDVKPEIELRNLADFELPEVDGTVKPEEVDEAINEVRRQRGTWKPVERAAARGDRVKLKVQERTQKAEAPASESESSEAEASEAEVSEVGAKADSEASTPAPEEPQDVVVEVGDPGVWEELSLAVTGLDAGKNSEFTRREGEGEESVERRFALTVEAVEEMEMPPLDDELAKGLGDFEDVAALRAGVEAQLARSKTDEGKRQRESALLRQLAERHPFPLPEGVVDHEVRHMLEDYAGGLMRRGVDPEKAELDWQAMADQARPQAENQVRVRLLLDAVASDRGITVTEDQFERTIAAIARAQGTSAPTLRRSLDEAGKLSGLRSQLRREAVVRRLLGDEPRLEAPEQAPEPAAKAPEGGEPVAPATESEAQ